MPKTVMSWYMSEPADWPALRVEKIIRDFVDDLGENGGVFELQHDFREPPNTCDSDIVVEGHYGQSDDRDSIQVRSGQEMKARLEKLLGFTVSIRLLPKDYAIFIK